MNTPICETTPPVRETASQSTAVQGLDWVAVYDRHHHTRFVRHESKSAADADLDGIEDECEGYSVATYHIPTATLHMRDPLSACDIEKVRAAIETWLKSP